MSSLIKMTSKQFLMLGRDPPGVRLELAHGEIIVSPSPSPRHSRVVIVLIALLEGHIRRGKLGKLFADTDTVFDDENTRRPDIIFISAGRLKMVGKKALLGSPDLCVEVISPSNEEMDRVEKFELYEKRGVLNYWMVDEEAKTFEAFVLMGGEYQLATRGSGEDVVHLPPFLDLEINLAEIWPE